MKTPAMKVKAAKGKAPQVRKMSPKPHIRMQKLKPVPPSAFPTAAAAFPTDAGPPSAADAMSGGPPSGASPGDMTE